jgi:hypothetical protein
MRLPLRTAVIIGAAAFGGTTGGTIATAVAKAYDLPLSGIGQFAAALFALWIADKLDGMIGDTDDPDSGAAHDTSGRKRLEGGGKRGRT